MKNLKKKASKKQGHQGLGVSFTADLYGCQNITNDPAQLKKIMLNCCKAIEATVLTTSFHKFEPQGLSGVVVIAESHVAIHTWPEFDFVAIDIFTCGNMKFEAGIDVLRKVFMPKKVTTILLNRGSGKPTKAIIQES